MSLLLLNKLADVSYSFNASAGTSSSGGVPAVVWLIILALIVFLIAAMWKVFQKAGKPGWAAIVPVYNLWVTFEIAGKPGWWALLALIPFVNIVAFVLEIIAVIEIAKRFGKSGAWGFFLLFLFSFIGWPILGFGKAQYQGGGGAPAQPAAPTGTAAAPPVNPAPPTV